jgi:plastocyanin
MNGRFLTASAVFAFAALAGAASPAATTAGVQPAATVHIADFAYKPPKVMIHTGESVLFVNDDDEAHTVTAGDKSFDSGALDTHDRWQHTFARAGTYTYFCALHPYMKAVVIVTDRGANGGP